MIEYLVSWAPMLAILVVFVVAIVLNQARAAKYNKVNSELAAAQVAESRKLNQTLERIASVLEKQR